MTQPTRVAVVRPKKTGPQAVGYLIGHLIGTALTAWFLMLILGEISPWHPSYWHALLALLGTRMVQVGSGWTRWTHSYGKGSYL